MNFFLFFQKKMYIMVMIKSFSCRFLALCACAFLVACSDEKPTQSKDQIIAEKCANGLSVGCLAGDWNFPRVGNATSDYTESARGTLELDEDNGKGTYCFNGSAGVGGTNYSHCGEFSLQDGKINIKCTSGDLDGDNNTVTIEISSPWKTLKIHGGSNKYTIFSSYSDNINLPSPVEIFER